jgi:hypothetical protein
LDGCPETFGGVRIRQVALEKAAVSGDDVFAAVAGDGDETIGGVENWVVCYAVVLYLVSEEI